MNLTNEFKAAVMAQKVRNKTTNVDMKLQGKRKSKASRNDFAREARAVCNKITMLRDFLLESRAAYMRIGHYLKSSGQMTDDQRDLIDRESEKFFIYYLQHLAQLRSDWLEQAKRQPSQYREHMESVWESLNIYLRRVQNIFLEQKRYRVQYELDSYHMLKLASDTKNIPAQPGRGLLRVSSSYASSDSGADSEDEESLQLYVGKEKTQQNTRQGIQESNKLRHRFKCKMGNEREEQDASVESIGELDLSNEQRRLSPASRQMAVDEDLHKSQQEQRNEIVNAKNAQLFEQENETLYQELQGVTQEIESIEKNVVEIAQLQDIFSEKVTSQQYNIERISNNVVGTTENIKDANEQIRRAIQRNAGLRVWSLFFLLVMSFTLLFLDWYYD